MPKTTPALAFLLALSTIVFLSAQVTTYHVGGQGDGSGPTPHQYRRYELDVKYQFQAATSGYQTVLVDAAVPGNGFVLESVEISYAYGLNGKPLNQGYDPNAFYHANLLSVYADGRLVGPTARNITSRSYGDRGVVIPGGSKFELGIRPSQYGSNGKSHGRVTLYGWRF